MAQIIQLQAVVPDEMAGERLDQVAARLFDDYSRSRLQSWIKQGSLLVDGAVFRPRDKVQAGSTLSVNAEPEQEVTWRPQDIDLDIIYEDDSIIVLNKPAGLWCTRRRGIAMARWLTHCSTMRRIWTSCPVAA